MSPMNILLCIFLQKSLQIVPYNPPVEAHVNLPYIQPALIAPPQVPESLGSMIGTASGGTPQFSSDIISDLSNHDDFFGVLAARLGGTRAEFNYMTHTGVEQLKTEAEEALNEALAKDEIAMVEKAEAVEAQKIAEEEAQNARLAKERFDTAQHEFETADRFRVRDISALNYWKSIAEESTEGGEAISDEKAKLAHELVRKAETAISERNYLGVVKGNKSVDAERAKEKAAEAKQAAEKEAHEALIAEEEAETAWLQAKTKALIAANARVEAERRP